MCPHCDGRGFHWIVTPIEKQTGYLTRASLYKPGASCTHCAGTGQQNRVSPLAIWIGLLGFVTTAVAGLALLH